MYRGMAVREVKICMVGDSSVGKTCITKRYVHNKFSETETVTVGASFVMATQNISGRYFQLHIWDTAGGERHRALGPLYYRDAEAAVVVYDITRKETFMMLKDWVEELQEKAPAKILLIIAGNKCDMSSERQVTYKEASVYATGVGADFYEVSAKCDVNIKPLFTALCTRLPACPTYDEHEGSITITKQEESRNKCC